MATTLGIAKGPGPFPLMLALFDMENGLRKLRFTSENGRAFVATIYAAERLEPSGKVWRLKGHIINEGGAFETLINYHTGTRKGTFTI